MEEEIDIPKIDYIILTPSGKCPVELKGYTEKDVKDWLKKFKNYNFKNYHHTIDSVTYWIRQYYDIFSEEYKIVKSLVEIHAEKYGIINVEKRRLEIRLRNLETEE